MLFPLLHGTADGPFLTAWVFHPAVTLGLLVAAVGYLLLLRQAKRQRHRLPNVWRIAAFYGGILSVAIALLGPLDTFNEDVFFLHMLQHQVMMQVAAPLLLLGQPGQVVLRALPPQVSRTVLRASLRTRARRWSLTVLTHPLPAFLLFNLNLMVWHTPFLYEAALNNDIVHDIQHLTFVNWSILCWWTIIDPIPRHHKLSIPWALGPLFLSSMIGTAIGALLTLTSSLIYPSYARAEQTWGLSNLVDQQIVGLLMWVGGGLLYAAIFMVMLARHFTLEERRATQRMREEQLV